MSTPSAIVVGAGPNGLFAACRLARAGVRVVVLETNDRCGGALWSEERTEPGFHHDVGAGFVAFTDSEAFRTLNLEARGLRWAWSPVESAHPAPDGSCPVISRDDDVSARSFGADDPSWRDLVAFHRRVEPAMLEMMKPFPRFLPPLSMGLDGIRLGRYFAHSGAGLARRLFHTPAGQRVLPAMGLHVDVGPEDRFGAGLSYVLALRAATAGYAVPVHGTESITRALVSELEMHGGEVHTGQRVERILTRGGRAVGVRTAVGDTFDASVVIADTSAAALYLRLLPDGDVPSRVRGSMRRFPQGWGTFKVDYALDGPVPWLAEACRRSAVVHVGDSLDDLDRFTRQVRRGELPDSPYLVVGQQSLADPTRAPHGKHTLYVYTHAPSHLPGGWAKHREVLADRITARIEGLAPGFTALVRARQVSDPEDLERMDANLVGGDLGGGSNQWFRQLVFRPVFPYFRYRTPVRGAYLGSSYTHPGAGIHGMCGWNAADMALRDIDRGRV